MLWAQVRDLGAQPPVLLLDRLRRMISVANHYLPSIIRRNTLAALRSCQADILVLLEASMHLSQTRRLIQLAVFALSLLLGWVYARTENLVVPIFVHGAFNAIQFGALYLAEIGALPS